MDTWFIVGMCILVPSAVVLGIAAFVPTRNQIKNWFNRPDRW